MKSNSHLPSPNSQSGITLVVSILLLATTTLISFVLAGIIIREIVAARSVFQTEPAIGAAYAGGEIALYRYYRDKGNLNQGSTATPQSGAEFEFSADLYDDIVNFTVDPGETVNIALYNAEDIDDQDVDYRSVRTQNGPHPIEAIVMSWSDPDPDCEYSTIPSNQQRTCNLSGPDFRTVVQITGKGVGSPSSGTVQAFDGPSGSGNIEGIPSDEPTFDSIGSAGQVQRRIEIRAR